MSYELLSQKENELLDGLLDPFQLTISYTETTDNEPQKLIAGKVEVGYTMKLGRGKETLDYTIVNFKTIEGKTDDELTLSEKFYLMKKADLIAAKYVEDRIEETRKELARLRSAKENLPISLEQYLEQATNEPL